ncbi:MAG: hypothetical protein AVDCRST_MAG22-3745, partial [uncultured Rubrobacteraceae bacterium]
DGSSQNEKGSRRGRDAGRGGKQRFRGGGGDAVWTGRGRPPPGPGAARRRGL